MLLHYKINHPIFILGDGIYSQELKTWIIDDGYTQIESVNHDNFYLIAPGSQIILGFQNLEFRKKLLSNFIIEQYHWPSFIHSSAVVTDKSSVQKGIVVNPQSVIGHKVTLEPFCNIGILSKIGHGTSLGVNTVVSPGTMIGGSSTVGRDVFFGQSCSIKDKIIICDDVYFTMNSVVKKHVVTAGKYYGNQKIN